MNISEIENRHYKVLCAVCDEPKKSPAYFCNKLSISIHQFYESLEFLVASDYVHHVEFSRGGLGNPIVMAYYDGIVLTNSGLSFIKEMKPRTTPIDLRVKSQDPELPSVFVSYNWKSAETVSSIEKILNGKAIVRRDIKDIQAWGSLTDFMKSIRKQDFAILVISEKYLKSDACLFEVIELMKDDGWKDKAMYVVLDDAHVYNPIDRANYIEHWTERCTMLEKKIKNLPASSTAELNEDLRKAKMIRDNIGKFLTMVAETSNPGLDSVFEDILSRVESKNIETPN